MEEDTRYRRHPVDLSTSFHFSGILNNAELEIVPLKITDSESPSHSSEAIVLRICVKIAQTRFEWVGSPETRLWQLLEECAASDSTIKQAIAPSTVDSVPVIMYLREQIAGEPALRETSLKSIGIISGSAMLQLSRRSIEPTLPTFSPSTSALHSTLSNKASLTVESSDPQVEVEASLPHIESESI
ncbi:unnamed protein product [Protopolystoma xenopodis]|uniref:Uncharacterized protein n=1 Tax=Protopolystoma xenopodis TaxID=117903 RepID=A0A448WCL6_9PLAT|nr:unnamed protein product [Protopolystoma xenopodis]